MSLCLRLTSSGPLPDGRDRIEMTDGALTVGRGAENDLSLPDPDRTLSKRHCVLEERGGDYVLRDLSTNGTFLNYAGEHIGDIPAPLSHGDVIQIGSFELVVEIAGASSAPDAPLPPAGDSLLLPAQAPTAEAVSHDPLGGSDDDFLDALLGAPAEPSAQRAAIPKDPFAADPLPAGDTPPEAWPALGASAPDHSPAAQDAFTAPEVQPGQIPDDWDDLFAPEPPAAPLPEAAPKPAAEPAAPMQPAPPPAPAPQPAPPPSAAPVPPAPTASDAALRAFLEGAGAPHLAIPEAETPETMARLGRVFAAMTAGMREILMTRAAIKSEMRMDRTMINNGGNNPLKFSISPEQAVEAMIRPTVRGYLDAEVATHEALGDIRAHEVAMMAGMEAALKALLARLGPDQLASRIEQGSSLGGLLGGKKARYWEAYEKMYAQIARETEDDFQSTFGREFARAYQDQLRKL
ncbi:type VI secretion system-associated FHA domain protein TagH [Salipiger bermudensis]|uniref:type VI secretion system-associated FHA domain protein TagH n=1 Tax=Salipiger bermudensis TaxID=344736 RepID=UPI001C997F6D|nr:type VI secretion system-associated FHA domain protein TagH [Salipiger bermudensis]MBY6003055.1 type VI secretion system-associated FHA domain protein TagH [Salipiger bermudensis]